ncbi:hypothetical protein ABOM_007968 [Aspergillus bombycis]|uniref:NADP-dependent oxidoreductase domain-containing protein n=1 Tax=Aspergillus bombycis TaxID=109264 RepID=A0A1F7ZU23_9EURO|nr:hypothetical protein ABOM_007968 [Aspergillus bombycis]OGM42575.1 hypothetical protein ABOM_007968 [Aspergillus bombycis]
MFALSNGIQIPAVGFGTLASEGAKGETYRAVSHTLIVGYGLLDCAWFYMNEQEIGEAIKDFLTVNSSVRREDVFIVTKVWNRLHQYEDVLWSMESSLQKLKLGYVDMFLVHWPIAVEKENCETPMLGPDGKYVFNRELTENPEPTWRNMEQLYAEGKARCIGTSNWAVAGLEKWLKFAEVKPHANQIEIHPFLPNNTLVEYCFDSDEAFNAIKKVKEGRHYRFVNINDIFGYDVWPEESA